LSIPDFRLRFLEGSARGPNCRLRALARRRRPALADIGRRALDHWLGLRRAPGLGLGSQTRRPGGRQDLPGRGVPGAGGVPNSGSGMTFDQAKREIAGLRGRI
jgi:hypothetical protein